MLLYDDYDDRVLRAVGLRLAGVRLLVGWHQSIADLVPVAEVVGLDQRGGQRVAAPVALAPLGVDADPHRRDVTDPPPFWGRLTADTAVNRPQNEG